MVSSARNHPEKILTSTAGDSTVYPHTLDLTTYTDDGPWFADGLKVRCCPANMVICTVSDLGMSRLEAEGNARLISAAVEMRRALLYVRDNLLDAIDGGEECRGRDQWLSDLIRRCDAGLAKVEARS